MPFIPAEEEWTCKVWRSVCLVRGVVAEDPERFLNCRARVSVEGVKASTQGRGPLQWFKCKFSLTDLLGKYDNADMVEGFVQAWYLSETDEGALASWEAILEAEPHGFALSLPLFIPINNRLRRFCTRHVERPAPPGLPPGDHLESCKVSLLDMLERPPFHIQVYSCTRFLLMQIKEMPSKGNEYFYGTA
jgi:hypothetical protein